MNGKNFNPRLGYFLTNHCKHRAASWSGDRRRLMACIDVGRDYFQQGNEETLSFIMRLQYRMSLTTKCCYVH